MNATTRCAGPVTLTARAVESAARCIVEGPRLDMQGLAKELGVSRVTLFRHLGGRDVLLGDALWLLTQRGLRDAIAEATSSTGGLLTTRVLQSLNEVTFASASLRRLLTAEPALTLRVLTDPRGRVQSGVVMGVSELLRRDQAESGCTASVDSDALAYALVRLGESFLYADVLAGRQPDVATANRLQSVLIASARLPGGRPVGPSPAAGEAAAWP